MLVRLLNALQPLRMLPGVLIGLGFRPERVQTMERAARPSG
jgi:hypothetical protein